MSKAAEYKQNKQEVSRTVILPPVKTFYPALEVFSLPDNELSVGVRLHLVAEGRAAHVDLAQRLCTVLLIFLALKVLQASGFAIVDEPSKKLFFKKTNFNLKIIFVSDLSWKILVLYLVTDPLKRQKIGSEHSTLK